MRAVSIAAVGDAVRGRRAELGWSQVELAHRAGISRKWIIEFEAGKGTAQLVVLLRVLAALGLEIDIAPRAASTAPGNIDLDAVIEAHRDGR
jgi:HTH-type transcriptional regulator / antitoxin HipB